MWQNDSEYGVGEQNDFKAVFINKNEERMFTYDTEEEVSWNLDEDEETDIEKIVSYEYIE